MIYEKHPKISGEVLIEKSQVKRNEWEKTSGVINEWCDPYYVYISPNLPCFYFEYLSVAINCTTIESLNLVSYRYTSSNCFDEVKIVFVINCF